MGKGLAKICPQSTLIESNANLTSSLATRSSISTPQPQSFFPSSRTFSSESTSLGNKIKHLTPTEQLTQSISNELLKDPTQESLSLTQRLDHHFPNFEPTPSILLQVLNQSPDAGRNVLDLHKWVSTHLGFKHDDETYSYLVEYFGRRKDFKVIHEILVDGRGITGPKTFASSVDRLVRAGRDVQTVAFFEKMEKDYGFVRDKESLKIVVAALCDHGFASYAEKLVKNVAHEIFPDELICDLLIRGWCVDGKLDEAKRLAGEIHRGGFDLGVVAYNSILDCVCKLCRIKDPFRLQSEAEKILIDMDYAGIPRNTETFNVLITNLCKIRKTEDALNLFERMGEWGCSPDSTTFLVLTKSLYQAARIGEGDEMIDRMKSAGFGEALDKKAYYEFLTILCGIERIDHAMKVFIKMKKDCKPGVRTYELLIGKLCAHGRVERANALFKDAKKRALSVTPKVYKLDPRFAKKPKAKKSEKPKRETLPEKMARKRTRLRKLRLSYVKKPKQRMRQAY
ncbi:Pentatricopeptide repeat-containing protein pnm1 protein [Thalictrum thalictroides]|uniref:Pentatricopeptide repeat-containing protein pnm1 protein n=1 Tax=Thalictrum thalictroides TaxID=46969 RepID=A0A7J6VKX5_THATH|nr:Pentatricopeptide repeat-containing protein pnm1 protein [Thalictrum thalictroides]